MFGREGAKVKAWKKFKKQTNTWMMKITMLGQRRGENSWTCYVQKRTKSTSAKRVAIANYESKLVKNIKQDSKSCRRYVGSTVSKNEASK